MIFTSLKFIAFFILTISIYFCIPKKFRWIWLLVCSAYFYISASIKYSLFLIFSILTVYSGALYIDSKNRSQEKYIKDNREKLSSDEKKAYKKSVERQKKLMLIIILIINLGILAFLKYYNFGITNLSNIIGKIGINFTPTILKLFLPLGISFYTFQLIGYIIDVFRGVAQAEKNIFKFALFASFFLQIMQGPINRYDTLAPQLYTGHEFDYKRVTFGMQRMVWGFFKKLVIADRLAILVDTVWADYPSYAGIQISIAVVMYAFQIYADFSGYMDISLGAGQALGINLEENFNCPYLSESVPDFWRRWHMTLGSFFKDYLFYPILRSGWCMNLGNYSKKLLGKNAAKQITTFIALIIVWFSTGLWHGASWHYIIWGVYYGNLIILSMLFKPVFDFIIGKFKMNRDRFSYKLLQILKTFIIVCFGYILFRSGSMSQAFGIMKASITNFLPTTALSFPSMGLDKPDMIVAIISLLVLFIVDICKYNSIKLREKIAEQGLWFRWTIYIGAVMSIVIFGIYGPGYNAASFIYFQF